MKKALVFFLMFLLLSGWAFLQAQEDLIVHKTTRMYGFNTNTPGGIISFPLESPSSSELLHAEDSYLASAAAYAEGSYYVALCNPDQTPYGIFAYDLTTGERELLADMSAAPSIISEMTYDWTTQTMYVLGEDYPATSLMTLDLKTGELSVVATIDLKVYNTLACSPDGRLFVTESSGMLSELDKETGLPTELGDLRTYAQGLQSMEFDYSTGKCYWAYTRYGSCALYEVDLESFTSKQVGSFPSNYQVVGLFPAYTEAVADAPAAVEELLLSPGEEGAQEVEISWKNPALTMAGEPLSSLSSVGIYRNDTLIHTEENILPGSTSSYTDLAARSGFHVYKLIPYNEIGEGMWQSASSYVGRDVPGSPASIQAEKQDQNTVVLSWDAPEAGLQGGWFDESSLSYDILRMPDSTVLATGLKDQTFTDRNVTAYNRYVYHIQSVSSDGKGGVAQTESVLLGDALALPFFSSLETEESLSLWTLYDMDSSGQSWQIGQSTGSRPGAESYADNSYQHPLDDWMVSPPLYIESGRDYLLSFHVRTAYYEAERFEIRLGSGNTPDEQTILVCDTTMKDYYGEDVSLLVVVEETGIYYLSFRHAMEIGSGFVLHLEDVEFKRNDEGSLKGTVTDVEGTPIENALVVLSDSLTVETDEEGRYAYPVLIEGQYPIQVSMTGYKDYKDTVEIVAMQETVADVKLESLPYWSLSGIVKDQGGNILSGARVCMDGYAHFEAYTDAEGRFEIDSVFEKENYTVRISKNAYKSVDMEQSMLDDVDLGEVKLSLSNIAPYSLSVTDTAPLTLSLERPLDLKEHSYDNGVPMANHSLGYDAGSEYHIMAAVYREPSAVRRVKWYTRASESPYKADLYHVYLFDLDEEGNPTANKLYEQKNIEGVDEQWFVLELDSAVIAPRGFMLALSGNGNVSMAIDTNTNPANQMARTQCYSINYNTANYLVYFEENGWNYRLLLRAEAEHLEPAESTPLNVVYDIYRFDVGDMDDADSWTMIGENITATTLEDDTFDALPQGIYQYAARAVYPVENLLSDPVFSEEIPVKMETDVRVELETNDASGSADGALVTMDNGAGHVYRATVKNGAAVFENVWKAEYALKISKAGYEDINETIIVDEEPSYTFTYTLMQILYPVDNIDVLETGTASERKVLWNTFANIFDSFEDGTAAADFELNPGSTAGWQYVDADGAPTYRFGNTSFPTSGAKMAAVLFNPLTTTPPHATRAYDGDRMLAFFCPSGGIPADDWLISPELDFYKDFEFSFYARKFNDDSVFYNDEYVSVGYSTTTADTASFIWLDEEPVVVPTAWTSFAYKIPAEAKFVALRRQCEDGFILFVDNISIGVSRPEPVQKKSADTYHVYLDGTKIAETSETEYLLTGLKNGTHYVGVTRVYETGESEDLTIAFTVSGSDASMEALAAQISGVYVDGDMLKIKGGCEGFELFDAVGHLCISDVAGKTEFHVGSLPAGVYVARIWGLDGEVRVYRVFIP